VERENEPKPKMLAAYQVLSLFRRKGRKMVLFYIFYLGMRNLISDSEPLGEKSSFDSTFGFQPSGLSVFQRLLRLSSAPKTFKRDWFRIVHI
jgi:hypothetical protein